MKVDLFNYTLRLSYRLLSKISGKAFYHMRLCVPVYTEPRGK